MYGVLEMCGVPEMGKGWGRAYGVRSWGFGVYDFFLVSFVGNFGWNWKCVGDFWGGLFLGWNGVLERGK